MNLRILGLLVHSNDIIEELFCFSVLVVRAFDKNISLTGSFHLLFCDLDLGTTIKLQLSDCVTSFTDDEANYVVRDWYDVGCGRGWTIWRHHRVIHWLIVNANLFTNVLQSLHLVLTRLALLRICQLGGHGQLFFPNFVSCAFIGIQDSVNNCSCFLNVLLCLTYNQNMLIILIVWLSGGPLFLRSFASYQNFTLWFFLKSLLVMTLWSDQ